MASAVADNNAPARPVRLPLAFVACILGALLSLGMPYFGLPVAAGALAWLWYRGQRLATFAVAIVSGGLTFLLNPAGPLYVIPFLLIVGPLVAVLVQHRSVATALFVSTVLMSSVWFGMVVGAASAQDMSVNGFLDSVVKTVTQPARDSIVGDTAAARDSREQITYLETAVARLWPAVIVIMSFFTALGTVLAVALSARASGAVVKSPPELDRLDLSPHVVWGLIVGGALLAADTFLGGWHGGVLGAVGENMLRITQWVLFLQGVAVFAGLYKRAGFSPLSKAFGYVLLGITEAFLPLVSLTGLVDMFVNVRKLPRDGVAQVAPPPTDASGAGPEEDRFTE
ncbi:MAG: hypothetical protein CVT59_03150 [Actinobacteria bacterium HGW-Actinobacteria-1]|jgi:uncharacterized protein YybS (DUF2232 family)|nr:MAG: hypothetical protein CVT59_03150 [Actinobacteria bacterium HGW-Actinobacteria-1]